MSIPHPQLPLGLSPREGERFDSFYAGRNQLSLDVTRATAEKGGEQQLALWGVSGVGKSHLLNAACHAAGACNRTAAYLPLSELIGQSPLLLQGLENLDVIAVDDIDLLHDHADWQKALFDLINRARQSQTSIITASVCNPTALDLLADLVSRLVWGPVLRLQMPGDDQLIDALASRSDLLGLTLSEEVVNYLLTRYSRELGALFAALAELDRASLAQQRKLTEPFVKSVMNMNSQ